MDFNSSLSNNNLQLIRQLGQGSYGTVYLVKHRISQQYMALKSVKLSEMDVQTKNKALNQVRLLASIDSPFVIKYQGAYFQGNSQTLNILMQYADEGDLQEKIQVMKKSKNKQGFDQQFIWQIAYGILKGLRILHQNKIVHRDLKSANIFFLQGNIKIGDLNVSKVINKKLCSTQTGTPYYTCPQVWKAAFYDEKCDIWSLGVILYELCELKYPFVASQLPTLIVKIMKGRYDAISSRYSAELAQIIKQCLTLNPKQRPTAKQLLQFSILSEIFCKFTRTTQDGEVFLLSQILFPKTTWALNRKLPKPKSLARNRNCSKQKAKQQVKFRVTKKLNPVSKKLIKSQCQIDRQFQNSSQSKIILSIKKINQSEKHLQLAPISKMSQAEFFFELTPQSKSKSIQKSKIMQKKKWRAFKKENQRKQTKQNAILYEPKLF